MSDPCDLNACDALALLRGKKLSATELLESCFSRIVRDEPIIGAWTYLDPALARSHATRLDQCGPEGALFGLPLGVKDLIDTADMPTEYGCPEIFKGWRPMADAACVSIAREANAIIAGKTVTQAFGCGLPVRTANPNNPQHTSGGSSAGSAAAVAAGMVPLAIGSQSASSVIRPASYNGIVGMRPSVPHVNCAGFKFFTGSFDTLGMLGRTVDDVSLLWHALVGREFEAGRVSRRAPRVAVCLPPWSNDIESAACDAVRHAAAALAKAGADVRELVLPAQFSTLADLHTRIQCYEASRSYAWEYQQHCDRLDTEVRALIEAGRQIAYDTYVDLDREAASARHAFPAVLGDADFVLSTAAPGEAPKGWHALKTAFQTMGNPSQSRAWTLLQVPAITVPYFRGPQGLPVGVQLIGRYGEDRMLLENAAWFEAFVGRYEAPQRQPFLMAG